MMNDVLAKREYNRDISSYLFELTILAGREVKRDEISSLKEIEIVRKKTQRISDYSSLEFTVPFYEKESARFSSYVENLYSTNSHAVYVWTKKTNVCGLFKLPSIREINFSFPFEINSEGIVAFITDDFENKLLLDFFLDPNGNKILEVEINGLQWVNLNYDGKSMGSDSIDS